MRGPKGRGRATRAIRPETYPSGVSLVAATALVGGVILSTLAYLRAFGGTLRPLGPDLYGYIWQTRMVGHAPLSAIEARPGVPVLGSVLAGLGVTSDGSAALVLAPVMILALGSAVGVTLRLAFQLPLWTLGVLGFAVTLWGGSVHLAEGHLANLLGLVCIVPAVLILAMPAGTWVGRMAGGVAAVTASGLAHAGFLPFYAAVAGLWLVFSIPSILRARREGARWWEEPSFSFVLALLAASAVVASVIFGVVGHSAADFTNIDDGIAVFGNRLSEIVTGVGLWISATSLLAVAGILTAWRSTRPRSRALTLLGVAWAVVSALGGLITITRPSFPGHRALGVILPLAALTGLGIVGIALAIGGSATKEPTGRSSGRWPVRMLVAVAVVVVAGVLVASPGLQRLADRVDLERKGDVARTIASYLAAVDPEVPVVVFSDPPTPMAALSWRGRWDQIRGLAPLAAIDRVFFLVGHLGEDLMPEQATAAGLVGDQASTYAVRQSWSEGGAALREDAIVVAPQDYVRDEAWRRLAADPARIVMPGLAVLRGPRASPKVLAPDAGLPTDQAAWRVFACLLAVGLLGGGYGAAVVLGRKGSMLDALALAPGLGAVVAVLLGTVVAVIGADPSEIGGQLLLGVGGAVGYVLAWRRIRERSQGKRMASPDVPPSRRSSIKPV